MIARYFRNALNECLGLGIVGSEVLSEHNVVVARVSGCDADYSFLGSLGEILADDACAVVWSGVVSEREVDYERLLALCSEVGCGLVVVVAVIEYSLHSVGDKHVGKCSARCHNVGIGCHAIVGVGFFHHIGLP